MSGCKGTLKDTFESEDYNEDGYLPIEMIKESFETLDLNVDNDLLDYIMFIIYQKSESIEKMNYKAIFDIIEGKLSQLSGNSSGDPNSTAKRKRPESSSPPKLKDRNKDKFPNKDQNEKLNSKKDNEDESDNYE